jgi:tRNA-Thr(GGU) m(6)t(6)A37 methyltransferase TsaA
MSTPGLARIRLLIVTACALYGLAPGAIVQAQTKGATAAVAAPTFTMSPVGWVRKHNGKTFIVIEPRYQAALLGVENLATLWVLYWFDRNDTPEQRAILQVHPRGDPERPLRGVFATRSPVRPNLIALSSVKVLSVRDNVIEIDDIDALPDTPVLDLKP